MSTKRHSPVFFGISLLLASVGLVWAQPADPLEQAAAELRIKEQKLVREVSANIDEARSLARSNPQKAYDILSKTKSLLEDDVSLQDRKRSDLLSQVNARLKDASAQMKAQKKTDDEAAAASAEKIRLQKKLADDDAKLTAGITPSMAINNVSQSILLQQKLNQAMLDYKVLSTQAQQTAMLAYLKAAMKKQQASDVYYGQAEKGTPKYKEIEIMRKLNSTLSVDFQDATIKKALEYLDDKAQNQLNILYDDPALGEAMIDVGEKKIGKDGALKMSKFTVRAVLKKILGEANLDYYIEDGSLRITKDEIAQKKMVIRFYPIRNLVSSGGGGGFGMAAMMQQMQAKQSAQSLALLMMSLVEPTSYWFINGGPGQVDWDAKSMSLAIKASVEMHYLVKASGVLSGQLPQ